MKWKIEDDGNLNIGKLELYDKDELHRLVKEVPNFYSLSMDERFELEHKMGIGVREEKLKELKEYILLHKEEINSISLTGKFTIEYRYIEELVKDTNIKKINLSRSNIHGDIGEEIKDFEIALDLLTLQEISESKDQSILKSNIGVIVPISEIKSYTSSFKFPIKGLTIEYISQLSKELLKKIDKNSTIKLERELRPPYNMDEIRRMISSMDKIKDSIQKDTGEFEKFMTAYYLLGEFIDYDSTGNIESKEYSVENCTRTRSVYSAIEEGQACCVGYALTLDQVLNYLGIDSKMISSENHARNLVKIDNKWYETDLCWDASLIKAGESPLYCLRAPNHDEDFCYDEEGQQLLETLELADESYNLKKIKDFAKSFMNNRSLKRQEVSQQDFSKNSKNTIIKDIFNKLKRIALKKNKEPFKDEYTDSDKEI